ncbi:Activating signal cointegrator 1 complex subunit 3 isoform a [Paragonimus heterotremus]|uniref:Activating signal cointegrator 1 complex subunit 3 isoform a n=1 Tax=Paragonimus heterotremus TaxID=100268 RepID=A0A8J4TCY0_9TREM|nr:Activating signal cointegrator 1 complex subunit 3 isoform a [Paragonimus heterotremus]
MLFHFKTNYHLHTAVSTTYIFSSNFFRLALSLPLATARAHDEPVVSSIKAVDLAVLFEELSPKAASLGIPLNELMDMVFVSLGSSRSSDIVQNELCELIGWDCIDLVFALLRERSAWVTTYQSRNDPENFVEQKNTRIASVSGEEPKSLVQQLIHDPVSVAAARAAQLEANARATAARLQQVMANGPSASTKAAEFKRSLPFVYDQLAELRERVAFVDSSRPRLPAGTTYKQLPLWDEVQFPAPTKPPSSVLDVPRVQVASLDSIGQQAFSGMQELNLIQSVVYPVAYHTAENLLVSAPTGAGKTNVAMLAIVQLLRSHLTKDSVLDLKSFKIVYLAPMKALAAELAATFSKRLAPLGLKVRECTGDMQLSKQEILETQIVYLAPMKALAAELAATFSKRLAPLGLKVRECTGDMQLSKQEILETQMLVSTPEKWDVISRKGSGDATLVTLVKLLIIDEIHLLHEDRGAVIEVLVARTLRQVETSQTLIRLVGLSATLPNYEDVAHFLHVNPYRGLFYFDDRFRPVPLRMSFYGVRGSNRRVQEANMNAACYELLLEQVKREEQVMVFVHARGDTVKTARWLCETARQQQQIAHFQAPERNDRSILMKRIDRCGDMALRELLPFGFACHHAGMLRQDRTLVERLFADGHIRTLVCTATLAWGVNLPAHAVIIKGTRVYKAEKSDFVELDILDVLQIFGRAGRPQFDTQGVASIITSIDKMDHYLRLITNQHPIESSLLSNLNDHLNAEIALGTVTNIDDAVTWLKDTYLFVRLMKNPLHYGIQADLSNADSTLSDYLGRVVRSSALDLDAAEMIRYEPQTGQLASTDRGRTASLFYIRFSTAAMVRDTLEPTTMLPQLFSVLSEASEFVAMKVRDEEGGELNDLKGSFCRIPIQKAGNVDSDVPAKVNALLQGYISRHSPVCHSLASDMNYIHQNAGRLVRYLFELSLRQGWSSCASTTLQLARMIEQRQWDGQTPLWQFASATSHRLLQRVDEMELSVDRIRETGVDELTHLLRFRGRDGAREVSQLAALVPRIQLSAETQPITRTILRVRMTLEPDFTWSDRSHGTQQNFWIWIEDPDQGLIYHSEYWTLTKRTFKSKEPSFVMCTIPLFEPFPTQYLVRVSSDQWLGADTVCPLSFKRLLLPPPDPPHTDLLNLEPLPVCALQNSQYELLYKFTHFNPIQTQIFHTLYHQDVNVLLGAPTGSGKTVAAELAIFRVFNETPSKKVRSIYQQN